MTSIKQLLLTFTLFIFPINSFTQNDILPDPEPYFSAIIVNNMEISLAWYSDNLGFKVLNNKAYEARGFKQANLKRGEILIELIEIDSALSAEKVIPNYTNKTRLHGIFKIGFIVSEFDKWMDHLKSLNVTFHGKVVLDSESGKKIVIIKDPDGNRIQIFEK